MLGVEYGLFQQAGEQLLVGLVQRLAGGGELLGDGFAVLAAADHRLDAADLPFDPGQALEHGVLMGGAGLFAHGVASVSVRRRVKAPRSSPRLKSLA
ncbi:hypothetical protein D3C86_1675370 [compost metagenome]